MQTATLKVQELPLFLNVKDLMEVLQIGRVKAYEIVNSDDFPAIRLDRRIVIRSDHFLDWLDKKMKRK